MCSVTADAERTLPMTPLAAGVARDFVAEQFCPEHSTSLLEDAQLLVSEAVANAVEHGGPPLILRVSCDPEDGLLVDVRDGSHDPPRLRRAETWEEHGRGMALIDLLSDDWGVRPDEPDGKVVWFRLRPQHAS